MRGALSGLLLLACSAAPVSLAAQVVSGRVVDEFERPVAMVHVVPMLGSTQMSAGTLTDRDGRFHLAFRGERPTAVAVRRIGYHAEPPLTLDWPATDRIHLAVVLHAIPLALPTVAVSADECAALDDLEPSSAAGLLVDAARSTIAAREAFQAQFAYQQRVTGHGYRDARRIPVDTTIEVRPPRPPIDTQLLAEPLISLRRGSLFRGGRLRMRSVDVRSLMQPSFLRRFCLVDVERGDEGAVTLVARLRPSDEAVTASMRIRFDSLAAGPSLITFEYLIDGRITATAENRYALFDVEGHRFPLESEISFTNLNPKTGAVGSTAVSRYRYTSFERVPPSAPEQPRVVP
jgi:hypothetical protein